METFLANLSLMDPIQPTPDDLKQTIGQTFLITYNQLKDSISPTKSGFLWLSIFLTQGFAPAWLTWNADGQYLPILPSFFTFNGNWPTSYDKESWDYLIRKYQARLANLNDYLMGS